MFAIVDIETCGGSFAYKKGRIIDICILVHDGISVIDKFSTLINPECHISGFFTNISGITNEMVQDAPRFFEVAKDILSYTEGKIFVAHNANFDYNFIRDEFDSLGYKFKRDTLCTVKLSRKLMPGKKSYSLGNLCADVGIEIQNRHRAEGDAIATAKLLDLLLQLKTQSSTYKSTKLSQIMSTRKDAIKKYILDKIPESCGVYYFLDQHKQIIYIGKSVNMYSRALSHYNTDLKKNRAMLHELTNVDYVETGSELISLLLESAEIKRHKPLYNRQRKKDVFTHCIDLRMNEDGIYELCIVPFAESEHGLQSFTSYAAAREKLESWIDEHALCLRYCGLSSDTCLSCFHHQIKKCKGICAGQESATDYNVRVSQIIKLYSYPRPNFIILDKGRHHQEKGFALIRNYTYQGYGYMDEQTQITDIDELSGHLHSKQVFPDDHDIVRGWLRQKRREIIFL
jgi:DNA polymerase-3 subunit epsilon